MSPQDKIGLALVVLGLAAVALTIWRSRKNKKSPTGKGNRFPTDPKQPRR